MAATPIFSTCPYCGVGCGIEAVADETTRTLKIKGDKQHPANFGKLCSKGSALAETIALSSRLLAPKIHGRECGWPEALQLIAETFKRTIRDYGPDAVAFYVSGQLLTEDYYVANKLMKGFIGSANIDTNSRLCMSSSVAAYKRAFGSDTVPGCYEDYESAELIVLVGSNAAWCHPVNFQRIRTAKEANPDLKVVVIDPRRTDSCDIADLHLAIASGTDTLLFNGLLAYLSKRQALDSVYIGEHTEGFDKALAAAQISSGDLASVSAQCRLVLEDMMQFFEWFGRCERVMTLYCQGVNQSTSGTDKANSIINCHLATGSIGKPGAGPFSLTGQPNAMGGREVGGLANQLAAHMDLHKPEDRACVGEIWGSDRIAERPGYTAVELFDAIDAGKIKAVWIMATNPAVTLPDADKVKRALQNCEFVVVSDCVARTDTMDLAHVQLPALGWSEKDGTVTNSERRISRQRALLPPAGKAKPDWWIICQVAGYMGYGQAFNYQSAFEIFREHARLSGHRNDSQHGFRDFDISAFANISRTDYDRLRPVQWPVNAKHPQGCKRLFGDGGFFTASGRARFISIIPRRPAHLPDADYPFILNTGRIRDQWHTMTRTALATRLNQHKSEPFVEVHPEDAATIGLADQSLAKISSAWGSMLARVNITDRQQRGHLFVPMHWTAQYAGSGRVCALVNPDFDPISKQPESKHTPVSIVTYQPAWYGFILSRQELRFDNVEYSVKINGEQFYRYELAGQKWPDDCRQWIHDALSTFACDNAQWQEYRDSARRTYRAARIIGQRLDAIVFISPDRRLPERGWLSGLFVKQALSNEERRVLLSGCPPQGTADVGRIVCSCFNVGTKTILNAIKTDKLSTHQQVGQCLKAGTNCGSCIPEIKALLK